MEHSITGEHSWYMDSFDLPDHDVQETMRNFPGYQEKTYMTLEELREGDTKGMTESDEETSGQEDGPYTHINKKTKGNKSKWKTKSSAKGKRYNSEKSTGFGKLKF
jgi:hypothetical protein